jgi:predicted TIM-barrel fold metal-dependent hydrolase
MKRFQLLIHVRMHPDMNPFPNNVGDRQPCGSELPRRQPGRISRRHAMVGLASTLPFLDHYVAKPAPAKLSRFDVPAGACDAHVHVIGDAHLFPMAADRTYTPSPATATALGEMLSAHHLSRCVIVAAAVYGDANDATIDASQQLGQSRTRGVAWLPKDRSSTSLRALKAAGITGFRVLLDTSGKTSSAALRAQFQARFDIAARWGWHLDISTPPDIIAACLPQLISSPVPLVLDYFGWIQGGLGQPGVDAILSLVRSGVAYVKLSEPYRLSDNAPDYPELKPVVDALIAANPDRILWGSGWPHVSGPVPGRPVAEITPNLPIDTGNLLSLFAAWVPDDGMRRKILVENPARLYGFGDA